MTSKQAHTQRVSICTAFASTSGVLAVVQILPYIRASIRGETKPSRVASAISLASNLVIVASMVAAKAGAGLVLPLVFIVTGTITMVLAIKYGHTEITKNDIRNGAVALLALVAYLVFGSEVGLIAMPIAQAAASLTIFTKLRRNPGTEDRVSWTILFIAGVLSVGSVVTDGAFDLAVLFASVIRLVAFTAIAGLALYQQYREQLIALAHAISEGHPHLHHIHHPAASDLALTA